MLFDLPSDEALYGAMQTNDPSFEGRAFVGVTSTGIFCRLVCPARTPKQENCRFFASPTDCVEAGFRPCKRCNPIGKIPDDMRDLLDALKANPEYPWAESDIIDRGYDPSHIRRLFKKQFGQTFLALARQRRLQLGFSTLTAGAKVIEAQLDAGFSSASAFRAAFQRLTGLAPGQLQTRARLNADWIDTPLGPMICVADTRNLYLLEFLERKALPREMQRLHKDAKGDLGLGRTAITDQTKAALTAYFDGSDPRLDLPLAPAGTDFERHVWHRLRQIPAGQTRSYSQLAQDMSKPNATRAVARANGANPIAIVIPCHRVIGADGALTGYGGGLWRKERLLKIEEHYATKRITP